MRLITIISIILLLLSCNTSKPTKKEVNGKVLDSNYDDNDGDWGTIGLGSTETIGHGVGVSDMDGDGILDIDDLYPMTADGVVHEVAHAVAEMAHAEESRVLISNNIAYGDVPPPLQIIEVSNNKVSSTTTSGGHVAYKIPTEMSVRSTYQVIVRISKSTVHIYENLNGEVKTSSIPITQTMEVKVIDPSPSDRKMFEVILDNKPIQLVENNENVTQWTFNVTPLKTGRSKLKVVISIIRDGHTKEVVYEDNVVVKADVTKTIPFFIASYWQWLITTLIIPFIIWFVKRKNKKEEE